MLFLALTLERRCLLLRREDMLVLLLAEAKTILRPKDWLLAETPSNGNVYPNIAAAGLTLVLFIDRSHSY